ncbi:unnamed protein product [Parnassius apollo]|uniref:(apollo) hypothetical protein n=1 Tax=Parnassius apollo TaxID=110799 RepID=A0A8S3XQP1_PARAO|nr:unnamed protein product [Parnassius apollo]
MIWTVPRLVKKLSFRWTKNVKLCGYVMHVKIVNLRVITRTLPFAATQCTQKAVWRRREEELASNLNIKVRAKSNRREVSLLPATIEEIGDLLDNKLSDTSPIFRKLRSTFLEDIKTIISQEMNLALNEFKNELTQATDFLAAEQADLKVKVEQKDKEIKDLRTQTLKLKKRSLYPPWSTVYH